MAEAKDLNSVKLPKTLPKSSRDTFHKLLVYVASSAFYGRSESGRKFVCRHKGHADMTITQLMNRFRKRKRLSAATARAARCVQSCLQSGSVESLENRLLLTINIQWDYTYDSSGFFNDPDAKAILEQVATDFESRIEDTLLPITPGGVNSWTAAISNPSTGNGASINNLSIAADTIIIYVGARNLPSGLGLGGPGGFSSSGTSTFNQELETRGQSGVNTSGTNDTDFGPWGGSISFDSLASWHFGLDAPSTGQSDFYSVALHETAHVLGFGTSDAFENLINGSNLFTGTEATADYGQAVPMDGHDTGTSDDAHFESGITSLIPGTATFQESAMDPAITTGTRKVLTNLDWAALEDIGWEVTPIAGPVDYGDAIDASDGFGIGNYQTRATDNGPRHAINSALYIGPTAPDGDDGTLNNANATADELSGTADEGFTGSNDLAAIAGVAQSFEINVTNLSGTNATLYGWIDFNGDGEFETGERASAAVNMGTDDGTVTLNFAATTADTDLAPFESVLRLRLSTDSNASAPTGPATDGEVEDHAITVYGQEFAYDSLPLFSWPETTSAEYYELEVNDVTNGESEIILQSRLYETSYRPESALAAGKYSWRYRPFVSGSFGAYSDLQSFEIFETSATPFVTDPFQAVDSAGVESLPTIAWSPYVDAARYELWLNDVTNSVNRFIFQNNLTTTSYTADQAFDEGTYRVFVRAIDSTGAASAWSSGYDFDVGSSTANAGEVTSPVGSSNNGAPTIAFRPTTGTNRLVVTNVDTSETVVDVDNLSELSYTVPTGLPAGLYEATIFANGLDAAGDSQRFEIVSSASEIEVTNIQASTTNTAPIIGWNPVDSATRYSVWINNVSQGISQEFYSVNEAGTAFQTAGLNSSDTYRVWVRAFDGFTPLTAWSAPVDFTIRESSAVPTIYSPSAATENTLPTVSWADVSGATTYELEVYDDSGLIQSYSPGTNFQTLQSPLAAGNYSAQVTAKDSSGTVLGSDVKNFTVQTGDSTIELFGTDGATMNPRPTFAWSAVSGADRYVIWVNDDTNALTATVFDSEITTTSFTANESLLAGRHRVWVRAFNGTTALTAWSLPSTFIVNETTGTPEIINEAVELGQTSATTTSPVPAITWTHVAGAASYDLQVLDTSGTVLQTLTGLTTTTARPILSAGTYDFQIRSVDAGGTESAFGSTYRLQIVGSDPATATQLVSPLVRSTVGSTGVLFAWTFPATDGITYDLWVSNLTLNTRPVFEQGLTGETYTAASLTAGKYRAWVRAIGTGINTGWSQGVDFTVAAVDHDSHPNLPGTDNSLNQMLLASLKTPVVVTEVNSKDLPADRVAYRNESAISETESKTESAVSADMIDRIELMADLTSDASIDDVMQGIADFGLSAE